jgi:hypothetical protein
MKVTLTQHQRTVPFFIAAAAWALIGNVAHAQRDKPNILVIWGDDIGQSNISAYGHGMMGYRTPNIDSIAKEGAMFTDYYGEQSCTAGRATRRNQGCTLNGGARSCGQQFPQASSPGISLRHSKSFRPAKQAVRGASMT